MKILSGDRPGYEVTVCQGRMSSMVPGILAGQRSGQVHSCFRTGLNLQFGENLIHLDGGEHGLCCFGLAITAQEMKQILLCCRAGDLAVYRKASLCLYGAGGVVRLSLSEFASVDLSIPRKTRDGLEETAGAQWFQKPECFLMLQERAEGYTLGLEKDDRFRFYAESLSGPSAAGGAEAVHFFAGRGQGLTPAGDDILTGYGAALQCFGKAGTLIQVLRRDGLQTTDVSRAYLHAMMQGFANEVFVWLLEQFWGGDPHLFQEALKQMEHIGHTSGCDTLYGLYLGLKKMKEDTQL